MRTLLALLSVFLALPIAADTLAWEWPPGAGAESHDVILSRNGEAYRFHSNVAEPRFELEVPPGESAVIMVQARHADGRDVGEVLVAEGHAREYDGGTREPWCE